MTIIGVDFHPEFQQIASVDTDTGEFQEKRLAHCEEAEKFYRALAASGQKVRVGMEASGHARWFERLLAELQIELWIGDAAEIRAKRVRKQKTDRQDAHRIRESVAARYGALAATTPMLATVSPFFIEGTAHTYRTTPLDGARASHTVLPNRFVT
jgi:transposase